MIKANDLRIGNWIQCDIWENGELSYLKVKAVANDSVFVDNHSGNFGGYDGIPLTVEILEKCGFIKVSNEDKRGIEYQKLFNRFGGHLEAGRYEEYYYVEYVNPPYSLSQLCHSVHDLQNLYFALTGKELEIKL